MIAILDYGAGNLFNAQKAVQALGYDSVVTDDEQTIRSAQKLILPGVGAFPDAMQNLRSRGLHELICQQVQQGKYLLGICLGMQLLFDHSDEMGGDDGLGLIAGKVRKIQTSYKIPHMGWNQLTYHTPHAVFNGIPQGESVYFVHSFCADVADEQDLIASTWYGERITAAVARDNVIGMQYHPEKSSRIGMHMLKNFIELK